MIKYENIKNDNTFILSEDKKFTYDELKNILIDATLSSDTDIVKLEYLTKTKLILGVTIGSEVVNFLLFFKNITGAGWADKPKIKRVQITNVALSITELNKENLEVIPLIVGYYNYDNNPIFVSWDAFRYTHHNTLRSCYVSVDTLKRGLEKRYYVGVDSSQRVWVYDKTHFGKFLREYANYAVIMKEEIHE